MGGFGIDWYLITSKTFTFLLTEVVESPARPTTPQAQPEQGKPPKKQKKEKKGE